MNASNSGMRVVNSKNANQNILNQAKKKKIPITLTETTAQSAFKTGRRDFIYVKDIADAFVELLGQWGMLVMSFYFGGRTLEKIMDMKAKNEPKS